MAHHLGQRGHGPDLEAAVGLLDPVQLLDLREVDDHLRLLEPILQPVHAVEPARQHPRIGAVLVEQLECIVHAGWLIQLEDRHDVSDYSHMCLSEIADC